MSNQPQGIVETLDVFAAVKAAIAAVNTYKEGGIQVNEYLLIFSTVLGPLLKAVEGGHKIPGELADLDEAELKQLEELGYGELLKNPAAKQLVFGLTVVADAIHDLVVDDIDGVEMA